MAEHDGLEDVRLDRDFGPFKAGETIRVDPGRAQWLRDRQTSPSLTGKPKPGPTAIPDPEASE
jgi:hypothetical protein